MVLSLDLGRTKSSGPCASSSPGMQLGPGCDQSGMQVGSEANAVCTARLSCIDGGRAHKARLTCPRASSFDIPTLPWGSRASPSRQAPDCPAVALQVVGSGEWRVHIHSPSHPSNVPRYQHLPVHLAISGSLRNRRGAGGKGVTA